MQPDFDVAAGVAFCTISRKAFSKVQMEELQYNGNVQKGGT